MSTAQDTVISMPELLELILALLPSAPYFSCLVSKTWQAITLTPGPQSTLFLQPDRGSEPIQNPLLVVTFPPFFASEPADEHEMRMPWAAKAEDAFKRKDASGDACWPLSPRHRR
ncbi:hypothetical protein B0H14DRAFT_3477524 [Mycena olivaceomarginata]|nr:hypothetical protein B0H14DRAFT_3477524 [Mycena olivaceomarginata]